MVVLVVIRFSYCLRLTYKRLQRSNGKAINLYKKNQSILVEYSLLYNKNFSFAGARTQTNTNFTKTDLDKPKIGQICAWNSMTTGMIMQTLIYVISMEFLLLRRRRLSWRNAPSGKERGETAVFAGYDPAGMLYGSAWNRIVCAFANLRPRVEVLP